jgi:hypothetical protein
MGTSKHLMRVPSLELGEVRAAASQPLRTIKRVSAASVLRSRSQRRLPLVR